MLKSVARWNRKLHIYVGLYFLFFIWTFAFSGLMLNHPKWEISQFWSNRKENAFKRPIRPPEARDDMARAADVMRQLGAAGEIQQVVSHPGENRFGFQVVRPGKIVQVQVGEADGIADVKEISTNGWGMLFMLHEFNGVRMEDPKEHRDWVVTRLWTMSMDALCLGLIFLVISSLYMWYQLDKKRRLPGLVALCTGVVCCGFFVFGLG